MKLDDVIRLCQESTEQIHAVITRTPRSDWRDMATTITSFYSAVSQLVLADEVISALLENGEDKIREAALLERAHIHAANANKKTSEIMTIRIGKSCDFNEKNE